MRSFQNNPEGVENTAATKQSDREIFALKMQRKNQIISEGIKAAEYDKNEEWNRASENQQFIPLNNPYEFSNDSEEKRYWLEGYREFLNQECPPID